MNYCIMHIEKIKTLGTLTSKYKHNYRIADVKNADKELESQNEETFKLPNGKTYTDVCKERIAEIEKSTGRKIRKDAVLALEIITTFSRSALINVDEWKKVNEKWLKDTFNKAPDGKSNVISMVYHADEAGNIHCHSLIIPINNKGYLSSTSFMNGSKTMRELQDSYAHAMETVGLERGQKGSIAKHKKIRHMYAELNKALDDIPELKEGESAASYKERLLEDIQNIRDSNSLEYNERIQEASKRITQEYNAQLEMYQKKIENNRTFAHAKIKELNGKINTLNEQVKELRNEKTCLEQSVLNLREMQYQLNEYSRRRNIEIKRMRLLQERLNKLFATDPEQHQKIMDILNHTTSRDDAIMDR